VKQALLITLMVCGPIVTLTMIIGFTLGFLQSVFQLQDQSLPFFVKLAATFLLLLAIGPWMADTLLQFTLAMFNMIGL
jgi:type III secretory pathway component EscS